MNKKDWKEIILGVSLVAPPVMMIIIGPALVPFVVWLAWVGLLLYANLTRPKKRKKTKFEHFELDKDFIKSVELEDIA